MFKEMGKKNPVHPFPFSSVSFFFPLFLSLKKTQTNKSLTWKTQYQRQFTLISWAASGSSSAVS